jgi:hypothetical protein
MGPITTAERIDLVKWYWGNDLRSEMPALSPSATGFSVTNNDRVSLARVSNAMKLRRHVSRHGFERPHNPTSALKPDQDSYA